MAIALSALKSEKTSLQYQSRLSEPAVVGRGGTATVVFLASPGGSFITGQIIAVDGGLLAHHPAYSEFIKGK